MVTSGTSSVCQDTHVGCRQPLPASQASIGGALQIPLAIPVVQDQTKGSCIATHNLGGLLVFPAGSFFPNVELKAQRDLSLGCYTGLGEGQCGQYGAASLTLQIWSVSVSLKQGVLQSHLRVLGFSQWCLVPEQLSLVVRGAESGIICITILVTSLSFL